MPEIRLSLPWLMIEPWIVLAELMLRPVADAPVALAWMVPELVIGPADADCSNTPLASVPPCAEIRPALAMPPTIVVAEARNPAAEAPDAWIVPELTTDPATLTDCR